MQKDKNHQIFQLHAKRQKSSIVFPIELRWRNSTPDRYDFWRIYTGFKAKRNYHINSDPSYGRSLKIKNKRDWTHSIYLNSGFNTWNISLEYDLNSIFYFRHWCSSLLL